MTSSKRVVHVKRVNQPNFKGIQTNATHTHGNWFAQSEKITLNIIVNSNYEEILNKFPVSQSKVQ